MTITMQFGRYRARIGADGADMAACQALRHLCFFGKPGLDRDDFDPRCQHLMIEDGKGRLIAAARMLLVPDAASLSQCYAAQYYDLARLAGQAGPSLELGRFCIAPDVQDADVVRAAWGALTQIVDDQGVQVLFGCTSFAGTDPEIYGLALAKLAAQHIGPEHLRPGVKAGEVVRLCDATGRGTAPLPSLLRSYLAMGGWVSDHAVIDRQMNTFHVFTCVDIAAVPPARAKALRAVMGAG
ncbi:MULTISPECIES: GNAT family N-acetyltransferase [unclassified Yoonia]|uniref:GNAT family N-acetyltransferase n=1 Tax=unclassified Yoonia TaxID=2629118 RepID=UPI002AFE06DF|nr:MULTISPECIES: GNAT family N-acyltransferase [unclassified Yoonia]